MGGVLGFLDQQEVAAPGELEGGAQPDLGRAARIAGILHHDLRGAAAVLDPGEHDAPAVAEHGDGRQRALELAEMAPVERQDPAAEPSPLPERGKGVEVGFAIVRRRRRDAVERKAVQATDQAQAAQTGRRVRRVGVQAFVLPSRPGAIRHQSPTRCSPPQRATGRTRPASTKAQLRNDLANGSRRPVTLQGR